MFSFTGGVVGGRVGGKGGKLLRIISSSLLSRYWRSIQPTFKAKHDFKVYFFLSVRLEDLKSQEHIYKQREQQMSVEVCYLRAALGTELPSEPVVFILWLWLIAVCVLCTTIFFSYC